MPGTTPNRGYPYSLPADPFDVPAAIEALARAVDTDMQDLMDATVRRPFAKVSATSPTPQIFPADVVTAARFDFVDVDSDGMTNLAQQPTRITPTSAGLYFIWGSIVRSDFSGSAGATDWYIFQNETALDRTNFHNSPGHSSSTQITIGSMAFADGVDDYFSVRFEPDRGIDDYRILQRQMAVFRLTNT
jgi:hypothetical protein